MIPTKTIQLDFWRHPTDILHLVQGEADGRKIQFKITDNGSAADLTGFIAIFAIRKPDGNVVVNSATITEAELGIVETTISSQVVTTAGNAHAELHLMKEGQLSKSFRIVTKVAPGVDIDGIAPSVSEFNALQTLIGQAETVISIADTELWPEVVANAQYFSDLAGAGRTVETVKANADNIAGHIADDENPHTVTLAQLGAAADADLADLAGVGRTIETVKGAADAVTNLAGAGRNTETVKANADEIAALEAEIETARDGAATLGARLDADNAEVSAQLAEKVQNFKIKNEIVNGNFEVKSAWSEFTFTYEVLNNEAIITALPNQDGYICQSFSQINSHKYYYKVDVKTQSNLVKTSISGSLAMAAHSGSGSYEVLSNIYTAKSTSQIYELRLQSVRTIDPRTIYAKNVILVDLTSTFGAGNEPTKLEMDELMKVIPNGWWDGELTLTQKQFVTWQLNLIRKNTNAIIAIGGTIV